MSLHYRNAMGLLFPLVLFLHGELAYPWRASDTNSSVTLDLRSHQRRDVVRVVSTETRYPLASFPVGVSAKELKETIKEVYVWAWPLVYLSNAQKSLRLVSSPGVSGGAPVAPVNSLCMLTEVTGAEFTSVPCPNRDVIYGFGMMDLSHGPVVVQVPDFPQDQYWHYQVGDHRTESFAELGSMYQTAPGFYLIAGPDWHGDLPEGFHRVFRSPTNLAYILPRILAAHQDRDSADALSHLEEIVIYPLRKYSGRFKTQDWTKRKWYPAIGESSRQRSKLVRPSAFFDDLRVVLDEVPPQKGEERLYQSARYVLQECDADPTFAESLRDIAEEIEESEIMPLFDFRNIGDPLPGYWTSVDNGARFGSDHRTRTAVAKSNIFVNKVDEAKYFYLEHAHDGSLLRGDRDYEITFAADKLPPHHGFWSLTLYDENHRLYSNPLQRHAFGSLDSDKLHWNLDGSLTISIGTKPRDGDKANWLPAPPGPIVLYLRVYVPQREVINGEWSPPPAIEVKASQTGPSSNFPVSGSLTST